MKMETRKRFECARLYVVCSFMTDKNAFRNKFCMKETIYENFVATDHDIFWSHDHPSIEFIANNTVFILKRTSGDKFELKAPQKGIYKFCFKNLAQTPKIVSFYIHVGHIPNKHDLAQDEHMGPLNIKIVELREALESNQSITGEQKYLKARDLRHRYTNMSTKKRIVYFTRSRVHCFCWYKYSSSGVYPQFVQQDDWLQ